MPFRDTKESRGVSTEHQSDGLVWDMLSGAGHAFKSHVDGTRQALGATIDLSDKENENGGERFGHVLGDASIFLGAACLMKRLPLLSSVGEGKLASITTGGLLGFTTPLRNGEDSINRLYNTGLGAGTMSIMEFGPGLINRAPGIAAMDKTGLASNFARFGMANGIAGMVNSEAQSFINTGHSASVGDLALSAGTWMALGTVAGVAGSHLDGARNSSFFQHAKDRWNETVKFMPRNFSEFIEPTPPLSNDGWFGQPMVRPRDVSRLMRQGVSDGMPGSNYYPEAEMANLFRPSDLPFLRPGYMRLVHFTNPESAANIAQNGFNYGKYFGVDEMTFASPLANGSSFVVKNNYRGEVALVMDMPFAEHRLHKRSFGGSKVIPPQRIVGVVGMPRNAQPPVNSEFIAPVAEPMPSLEEWMSKMGGASEDAGASAAADHLHVDQAPQPSTSADQNLPW